VNLLLGANMSDAPTLQSWWPYVSNLQR